MVEYKRRASKQPKIKRHDKEQVSVDFDKQWLMADSDLPKTRVSFKNYIFGSQHFSFLHKVLVHFVHACENLLVPLQGSLRRGKSQVDGTEEVIINFVQCNAQCIIRILHLQHSASSTFECCLCELLHCYLQIMIALFSGIHSFHSNSSCRWTAPHLCE